LARRLRLTPNTIFMAYFLSKNYIIALENLGMKLSELEVVEICHSSVLLACKLRERDIHCPMISHVLNAGGKKIDINSLEFMIKERALRKKEIEISHFYNWNMVMMTFYDFLEQFLSMGVVFDNDQIKQTQENWEESPKGEGVISATGMTEPINIASPRNRTGKKEGGDNSTQGGSKNASNITSPLERRGISKNNGTPGGKG